MNGQPLITVIIPVYNIMEYLPRCVHSVTAQTYKNLQIILVDDGSTDGTAQLCDELAAEDPRISVYHKENGGSSSARNLGLGKAQVKRRGNTSASWTAMIISKRICMKNCIPV